MVDMGKATYHDVTKELCVIYIQRSGVQVYVYVKRKDWHGSRGRGDMSDCFHAIMMANCTVSYRQSSCCTRVYSCTDSLGGILSVGTCSSSLMQANQGPLSSFVLVKNVRVCVRACG